MTRIALLSLVLVLSGGVCLAGDLKCPIGLSYIEGFDDIVDLHENNLKSDGYAVVDTVYIPVGLTLQPYLEINPNIGIGVDIGPAMMIYGDTDFFSLPLAVMGRYNFLPDSSISPYVRAGFSHPIASGDYVESSSTGFKAAFGLDFLKTEKITLSVEYAFDSAEIEFNDYQSSQTSTKKLKPSENSLSLLIRF